MAPATSTKDTEPMNKNELRQQTIDTYNKSAKELADYFRGIGSRVNDIELGLRLAGNPKAAKVIEIGCGDGRDARAIVERSDSYIGFDISSELIKLAREYVPTAKFEVADAVTFDYPGGQDVVFAFASLLHLDREELQKVFLAVTEALRSGGVFYMSLKYAPEYQEYIKEDSYGRRLFYLYDEKTIQSLAGTDYKQVYIKRQTHGKTEWLEIAFRKT
jgi:predicted TPR repeat methyltransferase